MEGKANPSATFPESRFCLLILCFICICLIQRPEGKERMRNTCFMFLLGTALGVGILVGVCKAQLAYDYYKYSCPNVENAVRKVMLGVVLTDPTAPAAFLRLLFHDCQVQGCDASILLDSGALRGNSEVVSGRNFGIRKLETIEYIKYILEAVCPGQVSCADIIALAAKESVSLSGGPNIQIPLGRKDSTTCSRQAADTHLPSPDITVDQLLNIFMSKGLNVEESVAIMGGHTVGGGHCLNIAGRLYGRHPDNPINPGFEALLRLYCPTKTPVTNLTIVPNDKTPLIFDNLYFRDVLMGKGLFTVDSSISRDPRTAPIVRQFAANVHHFFQVFSSAFVKLSSSNVLTKEKGQVRRECNRVN
ncbi:peroxidase 29-like [Herrania umbratica]|uniref:Peroxidase n=1 Tax=Herrania umbratica TaxID=108875 RepID=A0A6J1B3H1_9ROSI|nr:peroxidase 29-like [Herrania umbratica]